MKKSNSISINPTKRTLWKQIDVEVPPSNPQNSKKASETITDFLKNVHSTTKTDQ